jgi:DNA-binding transcriptional LysR family regulator
VLNIHHLELFYYVARAGGITAALPKIPYGIQQPAVSTQIGQLEGALGTVLFHRRPFTLTPTGREVYAHIAPFFSSLEALATRARAEAHNHLRLAASANVLREHVPAVLKRLQSETPDLRLTLREANHAAAEQMLREHEIDLAVVLFEKKPGAGIRSQPLMKLPLVLLVPEASPFRRDREVFAAAAGEGIPLIAPPEQEQLSVTFQQELKSRGHVWQTRIEASGVQLVEAYVAGGFGVGVSVEVPGAPLHPQVRAVRLGGFPQLVFGALWTGKLPPLTSRFLELAQLRARELRPRAR